jgi:hypothetical protein
MLRQNTLCKVAPRFLVYFIGSKALREIGSRNNTPAAFPPRGTIGR